jgi:PadR family transcriptional regulator, regulatory protein PadR
MLQGTLDMLVLQTPLPGPAHGYTIAHSIEQGSDAIGRVLNSAAA